MTETFHKKLNISDINEFIRINLNRLLLLAVILSGCFALRFAAYGKYVDMINDYTSARAGSFFFSSNYLGAPEDKTQYTISSFDGEKYQIDLEIRNYENSLLYNPEGVNFYYYITAEAFTDPGLTDKAIGYKTTIEYDVDGNEDAAMVRMVKSSDIESGGVVNPMIDNSGADYNAESSYKPIGLLKGYSSDGTEDGDGNKRGTADVRTLGKQVCRVTLQWTNKVKDKIYLRLSAHTVPPTTTSNIKTNDPLTIEKLSGSYVKERKTEIPDVLDKYESMVGVFESELNAVFILNPGDAGSGKVTAERTVNQNDYQVVYRLTCNQDASTRVYYNTEKLTPDSDLGEGKEDAKYPGMRYLVVDIPANGAQTCYFYRKSLSTEISGTAASDDDLRFVQVDKDGNIIEDEVPES